jgi:hypothetical protein
VFRRPTDAGAVDEIPDHLLDGIPEVPAMGKGAPPPSEDLHSVLEQVRQQMERAFATELSRVEDSFGWMVKDLEVRLATAQLQLQDARVENERVRADFTRKTEALRELKRTLESL